MKQLTRVLILVLALLAINDWEAFAQRRGGGGRGGGGRGGGMRGGGGGGGRGFSSRGAARPSVSGRGGFSGRGGYNRPSQLPSRGGRPGQRPDRGQIGSRPGQRPDRGQVGNRPSQLPGRGNINTGDRVTNIGDRNNVNVDRDGAINVNGDGDNWGGCCDYDNDYPWGAGLAVGAAAAWTAAAIGSTVYTLPPSCSSVYVHTSWYNHCGGVYYMPQFEGTTTSYVVVDDPH
jgi:hypothetical protein